jgi:hypothetical protein
MKSKDVINLFNEKMLTNIRTHLYKNKRIGIKQFLKLDIKIWREVKK